MIMRPGERWHCTNPSCQCAVLVESGGNVEGFNPRCACGGIMKKQYAAPQFSRAGEPITSTPENQLANPAHVEHPYWGEPVFSSRISQEK